MRATINNYLFPSMNSEIFLEEKSQIEKLIKKLDLEAAKARLDKAVQDYPNSSDIFDLYGEVLMSLNMLKEAKKAIEKSISISPESNGDKYMTMGQLLDKATSKLNYYNKGIAIYRIQLNGNSISNSEERENIRFAFSSALATLAELYMTSELCDSPGAEENCEKALAEAIQVCEENPDVLIQYSNLRILRAKDKEARNYMERALELITSPKNPDNFPDTEIICTLAKNFAELGDFHNAIKVLEILTKLDDHNLEYWYLLAFNQFKLKNYLHSQNCLEYLHEIQEKIKEVDQELFEAVAELDSELNKIGQTEGKLTNNPLHENDEMNQEADNQHSNQMNIDNE